MSKSKIDHDTQCAPQSRLTEKGKTTADEYIYIYIYEGCTEPTTTTTTTTTTMARANKFDGPKVWQQRVMRGRDANNYGRIMLIRQKI